MQQRKQNMSDTPHTDNPGMQSDRGQFTHRVACLFGTRPAAERASEDLVRAGYDLGSLEIVDHVADPATQADPHAGHGGGLWESIKNLFAGEDDANAYHEGVQRGNVLLTVRAAGADDADRITAILERHDPIDIEAHELEWRAGGWIGRGEAGAGLDAPGYAAAKPAFPTAATGAPAMSGSATQPLPLSADHAVTGKPAVAGSNVRVRTHIIEK
jgi:hypothetical protein